MIPSETARWAYALKPASWPKLLVPALLGQAIGAGAQGALRPGALVVGLVYTLALIGCVVLLNDWGDQDVDTLKRRLFPETCAPKTIPDGVLQARDVLYAGVGAGAGALGVSVWAELVFARPGATVGAAVGLALFVAYTLPPLRLNYRGGGELLAMLGVGLVLPLWNGYIQAGVLWPPQAAVLIPFSCLALASALASALADEHSDRLGGKVTLATLLGNAATRRAVRWALWAGGVGWLVLPWLAPGAIAAPVAWCAGGVVAFHGRRMLAVDPAAVSDAHGPIRRYKLHLHRAIWYSGVVVALGIWGAAS